MKVASKGKLVWRAGEPESIFSPHFLCRPTTLSQSFSSSSLTIPTQGTLLNYNTAPQFTSSDKNSIFNDISNGILQDLLTSQRPTDALARFTVLAFADLKKYKYYHWVAIPALIPSSNWHSASGWEDFREEKASVRDALLEHVQRYRDSTDAGFALVRRDATTEQVTLAPVTDFESFFAGVPEDEVSCGVVRLRVGSAAHLAAVPAHRPLH